MKSPFEKAAPRFITKGIPVFPCWKGSKKPCLTNGFNGASKDPSKIKEWAKAFPGANIGIVTGTSSGVMVLDVDMKEDANGKDELKKLCAQHRKLPETVWAKTPRGGIHIYFRAPTTARIRSRTNFPCPALDVRANGGYVLAPPSIVDQGTYDYGKRRNGYGIAGCPGWLVEILADKESKTYEPRPYTPSSHREIDKLIDALQTIPSTDYHTWVRVGMAIHSVEPNDQGLSIFDSWSSSGPGYNPKEVRWKWKSFKAGGVNESTIFYLAAQNGWKCKPEHYTNDTRRSGGHICKPRNQRR
jgi:hypothetical protein